MSTPAKPDTHEAAAASADPALVPDSSQTNQLLSSPETDSALDSLLKSELAPAPETAASAPAIETPAAVEPAPAAETPPAKQTTPPTPEGSATDQNKSLVDDLFKKDASAPAPEAKPDPFEDVKLRSDASPKTRETFDVLKKKARDEIAAAQARADQLAKDLEEAKKNSVPPDKLPDQIESELKELREFRATFDIERDPSFKQKYDSRTQANNEAVYGTLKAHGLRDDQIELLKKMGDSERVDAIGDLLEKIPHTSRLKVQAKLAENISIEDERARELSEARSKADQILKDKKEAPSKQVESFYKEVESHAKALIANVDFLAVAEVPASTPAAERQRLEAQNKEAAKLQGLFIKVLADESPKGKAEAALGLVYAHRLKAENGSLSAKVSELQKEIDDIKKASSVGKIGRAPAAPGSKPRPIETLDAGSNLDRLFKEAMGNS